VSQARTFARSSAIAGAFWLLAPLADFLRTALLHLFYGDGDRSPFRTEGARLLSLFIGAAIPAALLYCSIAALRRRPTGSGVGWISIAFGLFLIVAWSPPSFTPFAEVRSFVAEESEIGGFSPYFLLATGPLYVFAGVACLIGHRALRLSFGADVAPSPDRSADAVALAAGSGFSNRVSYDGAFPVRLRVAGYLATLWAVLMASLLLSRILDRDENARASTVVLQLLIGALTVVVAIYGAGAIRGSTRSVVRPSVLLIVFGVLYLSPVGVHALFPVGSSQAQWSKTSNELAALSLGGLVPVVIGALGLSARSALRRRFAVASDRGPDSTGLTTAVGASVDESVSALSFGAALLGLNSILLVPGPFALLLGLVALWRVARDRNKVGTAEAVFAIVSGGVGTFVLLFFTSRGGLR
jgi:hypothetical protein